MISWIATAFSLVGCFLNAKKVIWCWPIWIVGNFIWMYVSLFVHRDIAQFVLWVVFQALNSYGWYEWSKVK